MSQFCTAVTCMDGRIQLPVIEFLQTRFQVSYVDVVTEPGPNGILANNEDAQTIESIERRVRISVEKHASVGIAVVGHYDCAGNPTPQDEQRKHTLESITHIQGKFDVPVIGLWVDENWRVSEIST